MGHGLWFCGRILALLLPVVFAAPAALAVQEVGDLLGDDAGSEARRRRIAAVQLLAAADGPSSAVELARVVRESGDPRVREEAARGLGSMSAAPVASLVVGLAEHGAPGGVRRILGESLAGPGDRLGKLLERLKSRDVGDLGRALLVEAMGHDAQARARSALESLARTDDRLVSATALQALAARPDSSVVTYQLAALVLGTARAPDTLAAALDVLRTADAETLDQVKERIEELRDHRVESVSARAAFLDRRAQWLVEMEGRDRYRGTPYERPGPDPPEPTWSRPAVDEVWSFDTTGSQAGGRLEALKAELRERIGGLTGSGADVRIGFVAYRDHPRDASHRRNSYVTLAMPLTCDVQQALSWLEGIAPGGVDTHGQAISSALHEGLARMNWRWGAERRFHVIGEKLIDRPALAERTARVHHQADGAIVRVYTTDHRSEQLHGLARAAGTTLDRFPLGSAARIR